MVGLGERWATRELAFKPYPIGLLIIGPVEIVLDRLRDSRPDPDQIESVRVRSYEAAHKFTGEKYTTVNSNFVDAHLSIPFCLAAALTDGQMTIRQLTTERLRDPRLHELARRVTVSEDEAMTARFPHEWPVEITITMRDGTTPGGRVDQVKWSPRRPPTWDDIARKFTAMAEPVIGAAQSRMVIDLVATVDDLASVLPLMDAVRTKSVGRRRL